MKCPRCNFENPDTVKFCSECGTQFQKSEEVQASFTKTLQTPADELALGSLFADRYEIIDKLGKGGMGRVYKARDNQLDEYVALKLIRPEIASDEKTLERFGNELKLSRKISHKNVCRMFHMEKEGETPYISMEYVDGLDLKTLIKKQGKLSTDETIRIAQQVCEGLTAAHDLGIIHRDLKPQNIMIDKDGDAKIMDFGIARSLEAQGITATGVIVGTPDYISPEQADGETANQRSDIYSLGVILYELVTGGVPFKGETAFSVALKHKSQLPADPKKLNPELSDDLARLILICMEKERDRRYQTAADLLSDLKNIEAGFPLGTKIRPRRETFIATLIRIKLLIPALVGVCAVIALIFWQLLPRNTAIPVDPSGEPYLAIMYFKNNTGDENLDIWRSALSELLIADLSQSKYIKVLPGDRLYSMMKDLDLLDARNYASEDLEKVTADSGVTHILQGILTKSGDSFRINTTLQETGQMEIVGSNMAEGFGEESLHSMVDELTMRIKENFALSAEQIATDIDKEAGKITTSSPEAFKYYIEGRKYFNESDYETSLALMERAVAIDPDFAMAYRSMAAAYFALVSMPEFKKYSQKAFDLSDRLSEREKYTIQGQYYISLGEITYDKAIEAYSKLLEIYPDEYLGIVYLAMIYMSLEQWDIVIDLLNSSKPKTKRNVMHKSVALAEGYAAAGMYDKATDALENYLKNYPDGGVFRWYYARNYLFHAKYELALDQIDQAFALDPAQNFRISWVKGEIYHCQGDLIAAENEYQKVLQIERNSPHKYARDRLGNLYLMQGKLKASQQEFEQGVALTTELNELEWTSRFHLYLAYFHQRSGNFDEAIKECVEALNSAIKIDNPLYQIRALFWMGYNYLEMESLEEANRIASELKDLIEQGLAEKRIRFYYLLMGLLELSQKNFDMAIDYFKKAIALIPHQYSEYPKFTQNDHALFMDSLALAYYDSRDLEKAKAEYEGIQALNIGRIIYGDIYAKSFYMVGKIYEEQGNKSEAMENYETFLEILKDADSEIAEKEEVRERLIQLQQE